MFATIAPSTPARAAAAAQPSQFGEINGVRLTKIDETQQYAQESLSMALESDNSGRHVLRVAHLYLARQRLFHLSAQDWEVNLIALCRKIFGPAPALPPDFGWLGQGAQLNWQGKISGSVYDELARDVDAVFQDPSARFDSEQLKAFRLMQLLHPKERMNFFQLCYSITGGVRPHYLYLLPTTDLPPSTQEVVRKWHAGTQTVFVSELLLSLCQDRIALRESAMPDFLELDLSDWFTLRFLNWFALAAFPSAPPPPVPTVVSTTAAHLAPVTAHLHLQTLMHGQHPQATLLPTLDQVVRGHVHLELLSAYMDYFFSAAEAEDNNARQRAIFRWSIAELWLTRTFASPILLQACRVLALHVARKPDLFPAFAEAMSEFITANVQNGVFEDTFPALCELTHLLLTPWNSNKEQANLLDYVPFVKDNAGLFIKLFYELLKRLDSEPSPSLKSLDAFLKLFDAKQGLLTNATFAILALVENDAAELPSAVTKCAETRALLEQISFAPFTTGTSTGPRLAEAQSKLAGVVRELVFKFPQAATNHSSATGRNLQRLSELFEIPIPTPTSTNTSFSALSSTAASFLANPDRHTVFGVPQWIARSGKDDMAHRYARFRALTKTGREQILDGTRDGSMHSLQFVGNYAQRAAERNEVPAVVWAVKRAGLGAQARAILADSRNLVWFLLLLALSQVVWGDNRRQVLRILLLAAYCLGAGVLRSFAALFWAIGLFVALLATLQ